VCTMDNVLCCELRQAVMGISGYSKLGKKIFSELESDYIWGRITYIRKIDGGSERH
jgi:hypothetical protein